MTTPALKRSRCSGCGTEILWVTSPLGKALPLDAGSLIYELTDRVHDGRPVVRIRGHAWVSHFRTCSKASQFSGGKRPAQGYQPASGPEHPIPPQGGSALLAPPPTTEGPCPANTSRSAS